MSAAGAVASAGERGADADSARYQAMGAYYAGKLARSADADSARYQAMAAYYDDGIPYTDVAKFYVERLRAEIARKSGAGWAVANPELSAARLHYRAATGFLTANPVLSAARRGFAANGGLYAANPELSFARLGYGAAAAAAAQACADQIDASRLADNPELAFFNQSLSC